MANPTNRRPILKKNVEAFVPSPRFLSESPARQPSSGKPTPHISQPGQPLPPHVFSPSPSRYLRSPVPPPPANLFKGNASAFNVDPGIPFLATIGPSDAGNYDQGSINEDESSKLSVGGIVTGLRKALTIKRSRRQSSKYQPAADDIHPPPPIMFRDSGYAPSDQLEEPPANQPLPLTTFSPYPLPSPLDFPPATAELPLDDYQAPNDQIHSPAATPQGVPSLDSVASAISAHVEYGPDYAKMDRPTPPHSDVSFNTYMNRFQDFVQDVVALPWMGKERVTVDYYPSAKERRNKRLSHRPAIIWRSQDYNHADYHLDSDSESSSLKMISHLHVRAPSRTSRADIDLDSEFPDKTHPSLPHHPPNTVRTPDHRRVQSEGTGTLPLFPPNNGPTSDVPQTHDDDPRFGLQVNDGNPKTPPAQKTPTLASPRLSENGDLYTLPSSPQNPALFNTPSGRRHSLNQKGGPESPPANSRRTRGRSRTDGEDTRLVSRNDTAAFSSEASIGHHTPSVRPSLNTRGDPFRTSPTSSHHRWQDNTSPNHIPETPPYNRTPRSGSPSRRSHRSHSSSQRPHRQSSEEWESYPQHRPGYVPFEYSENYYGTRYGVGIHGLLPPVARVSSPASSITPSIKQPQPQYPKSTLMTPPSRTSFSP